MQYRITALFYIQHCDVTNLVPGFRVALDGEVGFEVTRVFLKHWVRVLSKPVASVTLVVGLVWDNTQSKLHFPSVTLV